MIWIFIIFFVGCSESQLPKEKKTVNAFQKPDHRTPQLISTDLSYSPFCSMIP